MKTSKNHRGGSF